MIRIEMIENDNNFDFPSPLSTSARCEQHLIFHWASLYLDRGWSVIPLVGKKPAIRTWKEFQDRRPTRQELSLWFGGEKPLHTNIGIVTGNISGVIGIDFDSAQAEVDWLKTHPSSPLTVRTGSGNAHIYYQVNPAVEVRNRVRLGGHKLDVRGNGGYLVAPSSIHPNGEPYRWENSGEDYRLDAVPVIDSAWLAVSNQSDNAKAISISTLNVSPSNYEHFSDVVIRDPRRYIRAIPSVQGENGSAACFRVACILLRAGLTPEETLDEMIEWNLLCAAPPWSEKELRKKIVDAAKRI